LSEAHYLELLERAPARSRVSVRLIAAQPIERLVDSVREDYYRFTGFRTEALALREIAMVHLPAALPAIDRGLKRAEEA
jgi:hypothetical protein